MREKQADAPGRFPILVLLVKIALIFLAVEMVTWAVMGRIPLSLGESEKRIADIVLLTLLAAPLSYVFAIRPHVLRANRVLAQLDASRQELMDSHRQLEFHKRAVDEHAIVSITDADGVITYANDKFCQASGYAMEELLGRKHSIIKSGDTPDDFYAEMWKTISYGAVWHGVFKNKRKNGEAYWVESTIFPLLDDTGNPAQYISIRTDISTLKRAQLELMQASRHRAVSQLSGGISHEINSPIQYIGNNLEFIRDSIDTMRQLVADEGKREDRDGEEGLSYYFEEIPEAIGQSLEGVKKVSNVVQALKEFSQPGMNRKMPVNLNRLLTASMTMSWGEWHEVAEMDLQRSQDLRNINGLPTELGQVFLHLIMNAAQAIRARGGGEKGVITIETENSHDGVVCRVGDTGVGISGEDAEHIFDPFYTSGDKGKGMGQGLTLAYDIVVNKHGGTISLDSTVGEGSTFTVLLPLGEPD